MIHKKHVPRNGIIYFWFNSLNYKPCTLRLPSKRIYQRDGHGYNEGARSTSLRLTKFQILYVRERTNEAQR